MAESSTKGLCPKCNKGYMVTEYSRSEKRDVYYCNHCFKYSELGVLTDPKLDLSDLSSEEIEEFLDRAFRNIF